MKIITVYTETMTYLFLSRSRNFNVLPNSLNASSETSWILFESRAKCRKLRNGCKAAEGISSNKLLPSPNHAKLA